MIINCPICNGQLTITPQHFGQNVNCPHCARLFQVPAAAQQAAPQATQPTQAQPPGSPPMAGPVPPHLRQGASTPQATARMPGQAAAAQPSTSQAATIEDSSEALARFREKRSKASSKIIIWVVAIAVGIPAVIGLVVLLIVVDKSTKESKEQKRIAKETREKAISMAKNNLSPRGYTIKTDTIKISGGTKTPTVAGRAVKGDEVHNFECRFRITETSEKFVWSVEYIEIDGQVVFSK